MEKVNQTLEIVNDAKMTRTYLASAPNYFQDDFKNTSPSKEVNKTKPQPTKN